MCIDPADAAPFEPRSPDHFHNFLGACGGKHGQLLDEGKHFRVATNEPQQEFSLNELMTGYLPVEQRLRQLGKASSKMIRPDGSIHQHHG